MRLLLREAGRAKAFMRRLERTLGPVQQVMAHGTQPLALTQGDERLLPLTALADPFAQLAPVLGRLGATVSFEEPEPGARRRLDVAGSPRGTERAITRAQSGVSVDGSTTRTDGSARVVAPPADARAALDASATAAPVGADISGWAAAIRAATPDGDQGTAARAATADGDAVQARTAERIRERMRAAGALSGFRTPLRIAAAPSDVHDAVPRAGWDHEAIQSAASWQRDAARTLDAIRAGSAAARDQHVDAKQQLAGAGERHRPSEVAEVAQRGSAVGQPGQPTWSDPRQPTAPGQWQPTLSDLGQRPLSDPQQQTVSLPQHQQRLAAPAASPGLDAAGATGLRRLAAMATERIDEPAGAVERTSPAVPPMRIEAELDRLLRREAAMHGIDTDGAVR